MPYTLHALLAKRRCLREVIISPAVEALLQSLEVVSLGSDEPVDPTGAAFVPDPPAEGIVLGWVRLSQNLNKSPIPGVDLALTLPTDPVAPAPFKFMGESTPGAVAFKLWVVLRAQGQARLAFRFVGQIPGWGLKPARLDPLPDGRVALTAADGAGPILVSRGGEAGDALGPALLIEGTSQTPASIRFTPDTNATDRVVAFGLEPDTVTFGSSGVGFRCPAIVLDDSTEHPAPGSGAPGLDPPLARIDADNAIWRGLLARQLDFYLPADVPFFGGRPIAGYLALPFDGSPQLVIETRVPALPAQGGRSARPGFSARIECLDGMARGLSGLVPTLISAAMELPLDGAQADVPGRGPITFAAGKPVTARLTLARTPADGVFRLGLALQAQGENGLLSVTTSPGEGNFSPSKIFNTAAALATALIADQGLKNDFAAGDTAGVALSALAAGGAALSSLFQPESRFVLHGVELTTAGQGLPVGKPITLQVDYSVSVRVIPIEIPGAFSVGMDPARPMRIRVRRLTLTVDPAGGGLGMFDLDYDRAEMEIEDPGAWNLTGLRQLFDVLGTRSGRGSAWIEVDLRFKLNLGPIKVSGMTLRATLKGAVPEVSVRGLDARLDVPGLVTGHGSLHLIENGFEAHLGASLVPLGVTADAGIIYQPGLLILDLKVDLPAPVPLANSGLGLFGIGGLLGLGAAPALPPDPNPIMVLLRWDPTDDKIYTAAPGQSTVGVAAVIGTLPDLGFSFSAKAGLSVSTPQLMIRAGLNGRVLHPVMKLTDSSLPEDTPGDPAIRYLGLLGADARALDLTVLGHGDFRPLLEIKVPVAGHFPFAGADDWQLYLGADGHPEQGRAIGPVSARVLPGLLDLGGDVYLMFRGRGIKAWPHGRALPAGPLTVTNGCVIAFGFALHGRFGAYPVAWADLNATLDLLLGAQPPTLAGFGRARGSMHLGPFSIGAQVGVTFLAQGDQHHFWAEVTAKVDLFFTEVKGKVTLAYGPALQPTLPPPDRHPLDRLGRDGRVEGSTPALTDDTYRVLTPLSESPGIPPERHVWPDAMVSIPFAFAPVVQDSAALQFPGAQDPATLPPAAPLGTEMLRYTWSLDKLSLVDVTDEADPHHGPGIAPAGQLAAAWQSPRGVAGGVAELILFSTGGDRWVNRAAQPHTGEAHQALERAATVCQIKFGALPGWALGYLAGPEAGGFRLPPEEVSTDPGQSRVIAHLRHLGAKFDGSRLALAGIHTLPPNYALVPAALARFDPARKVERPFEGYLRFPTVRRLAEVDPPPDGFKGQGIELRLESGLSEGLLVLVGTRTHFETRTGVWVSDERSAWSLDRATMVPLPDGQVAVLYRQRSPETSLVTISYPLGAAVGIAGIGGMSAAAIAATATRNAAQAALAERLKQAAKQDLPNTPHQRAILAPGRLYRLDFGLSWSGELHGQDETGARRLLTSAQDRNYLRPGIGLTATDRSLFFRTAAARPAAPKLRPGERRYAAWLHQSHHVFHPELIERYFGGYTPRQSDQFHFRSDPLDAHFTQDHVAALAKAYGYELQLTRRRTDQLSASANGIRPEWRALADPSVLGPADRLRHDLAVASPCIVPKPGATARIGGDLDAETWYELAVEARPADPAHEAGRLRGITFRTSRWKGPADMLAALGLTVTSNGGRPAETVLTGDLEVPAPASSDDGLIEGDLAWQQMLGALGLGRWPVASVPRLSRFWLRAPAPGGWLFAGLMLESPEPIHRPGRLTFAEYGPSLAMGQAGASVKFSILRRDRAGARLLFLTPTPFQVVTRGRIPGFGPGITHPVKPLLSFDAVALGEPVTATLLLPVAPAFADDP